jgi:hypothetical protein
MLRIRSYPYRFEDRLAEYKTQLEHEAAQLKPGPDRDDLLRRARRIGATKHINEWLNSPVSDRRGSGVT